MNSKTRAEIEEVMLLMDDAESMAFAIYEALYYSPTEGKAFAGAIHGLGRLLEYTKKDLDKAVFGAAAGQGAAV